MKTKFDERGITLIELLIALVISGIIVGAIYRLFVAQTRSYTVQDQVAEVQQNVRSAMEILVRDIRNAGYDKDSPAYNGEVEIGRIVVHGAIIPDASAPAAKSKITIRYEHKIGLREVTYSVDANDRLIRNQIPADVGATAGGDPILENVERFALEYGADKDISGTWFNDRRLHGWFQAGATAPATIVAVRVQLSARPNSGNPDLDKLSPRSLDTAVAVRNQMNSKKTLPPY
jgi:type IV pilus assembly protein PilW